MHRVTSRVLAGEELCRNNDYLDVSMEFSESIFVNGMFLSMIPLGPLRPFGSWIGSFRHRRKLEKALKVVLPVVEQHLDRKASDPKPSSNPNAIDWTIELATSLPKENNPRRIALHVLHNLWAGSAATGGLVTQMVFQLLMEPKYLSPLVAEIDKAVSTHGWSEKSLNNMPLLDSYIREINRLYPTGSGSSPSLPIPLPSKPSIKINTTTTTVKSHLCPHNHERTLSLPRRSGLTCRELHRHPRHGDPARSRKLRKQPRLRRVPLHPPAA